MAKRQNSSRYNALTANVQDVIFGRGNHLKKHPGNIHYRSLVNALKDYYVVVAKEHKNVVCALVYESIKGRDPPGRFLEERPEGEYRELGKKEAVQKKIGQCFRERQRVIKAKAPSEPIQILSENELHVKIQEMRKILMEMNMTNSKVQANEDRSSFLETHESMSSYAPMSVNQLTAVYLLPPQDEGEAFAFEQVDFIEPFTTLSTRDRNMVPAMVHNNQDLETNSVHPRPPKLFCREDEDSDAGINYQIDKKYRSLSQTAVDIEAISWITSNFQEVDNVEPVIDFQHQDDTMDTIDAISYFFHSKEDSTLIGPSYFIESLRDDITQNTGTVVSNCFIPLNSLFDPMEDCYATQRSCLYPNLPMIPDPLFKPSCPSFAYMQGYSMTLEMNDQEDKDNMD